MYLHVYMSCFVDSNFSVCCTPLSEIKSIAKVCGSQVRIRSSESGSCADADVYWNLAFRALWDNNSGTPQYQGRQAGGQAGEQFVRGEGGEVVSAAVVM